MGEDPYRRISLLCLASKILEHPLLPYLNEDLVFFRKGRSPASALLPLSQAIADGFNGKKPAKRTVAVLIDIFKAYIMTVSSKNSVTLFSLTTK